MASQQDILAALAEETGPIKAADIAKKLNTKVNLINTSLRRMVEHRLLTLDAEGGYVVSEAGSEEANPQTAEEAGTTEYEQFKSIGLRIGVAPEVVRLTAEHVWRAGDWRDIEWVYKGMVENGVRSDLLQRWCNQWRGVLQVPIPAALVGELGRKVGEKPGATVESKTKEEAAADVNRVGKRDYIITPDDRPVYAGEGLGDLDYKDALNLANLRAAGKARIVTGAGGGGESTTESVLAIAQALVEMTRGTNGNGNGNGAGKKMIVVTQSAQGMQMQEVDAEHPMILQPNTEKAPEKPRTTLVVRPDGQYEEVEAGRPIVISMPAAPAPQNPQGAHPGPAQYIIVHDDGTQEVVPAGSPVIINPRSPVNSGNPTINAVGPDGKPLVIDLSTYFALDEHKRKMERDDESHKNKQEIITGLKDFLTKGSAALGNMGGA